MITGVDESNFSPSLAGDCIVCAFARTGRQVEGVDDSKKLTPKRRLELFPELQKESLYYVVPATPNSISRINIYLARNIAVFSAIKGLSALLSFSGVERPEKCIIDGYWSQSWLRVLSQELGLPVEGLINGDESVYEISAASIIAKCYCDALFAGWERMYPNWAINCHHGALTKEDKTVLRARGPSPLHRVGKYGTTWWKNILEGGQRGEVKEEAD